MSIQIQRIYDEPHKSGHNVFLVDRVWPRGVSKEELGDVEWLKDVAPSTELRKWFGHDPDKWKSFVKKYQDELDDHPDAWEPILKAAKRGRVTLLYGAKDEEHNQAVALKDYLDAKLKRKH